MALIDDLKKMRLYFKGGITKTYSFRKEQLKKLKSSILHHEQDLYNALYTDLKTWVTETGLVISELNAAIKNLQLWMQPEKVDTNLLNLPSSQHHCYLLHPAKLVQ